MKQIKFEKGKKLEFKNASGTSNIVDLVGSLTRIANKYDGDKNKVINDLKELVPTYYKLGYGGSHIWCANADNERIFIVEGF